MKKLIFGLVLLALLAAVVMQQQPKSTSQTLPELPKFTVGNVTAFEIKMNQENAIKATRDGETWLLTEPEQPTPVKAVVVGQLLSDLSNMQPKRVASHNPEHHARFSVADTDASVQLYNADGEVILHLMVGKPATDLVSTYVRLAGDDMVVTVDKTLTWQVKRTKEAWLVEEKDSE